MGAERQDRDPGAPSSRKPGTEPGLGGTTPAASGRTPAAASTAAHQAGDDAPAAVDFDALHAALGDPLDFDELPPAAAEVPSAGVAESSGRTNAAYASARPHTIPPSYSPIEDVNAPPVIVASEDTVPSAPPQMTVPLAHTPIGLTPLSGVPFLVGPAAGGPPPGRAPSGPQHVGHPSSGPHASAAAGLSLPHTPQPFPVQRGAAQLTMRMPDRPLNPRRGAAPTLIVRPRGPSAKQRLLVFMGMLLLFTVGGIAMVVWRKTWLGVDPSVAVTPTSAGPAASAAPPEATAATPPPVVASAHATASATPPAPATASVRVIRPRPAPAPLAPPAPHPSAGR